MKTMKLHKLTHLSHNKAIAIVIWLIGAWLTAQTLGQLQIAMPINIILGFAIQWALTRAESPIWKGKAYHWLSIAALVVDVAINAAGAWPYVKELYRTDFWRMMQDIMKTDTDPTIATLVVIVVVIGVFTAYGAEFFWNEGE
jgi:hypothetical protein